MNGPEWLHQAACAAWPHRLWESTNTYERRVAVSVCNGCPVRTPCLHLALADERQYAWRNPPTVRGPIYGGLNRRERDLVSSSARNPLGVPT